MKKYWKNCKFVNDALKTQIKLVKILLTEWVKWAIEFSGGQLMYNSQGKC